MGNSKSFTGRPIFQKRFGRFTFRVHRMREVQPLVLDDGRTVVRSVLRGHTPFEQRLRRIFPSLYPGMWPQDARCLGTISLPWPRGEIDIDIYDHKANRPAP